jgi:hypothetical protein
MASINPSAAVFNVSGSPLPRWGSNLSAGSVFMAITLFCTLLSHIGEISFGGFTIRGWAWSIVLVAAMFFLLPHRFRNPVKCCCWIWIPWVAWMIEKTDFSNREAAQRFFIFITPLLTLLACSSFQQIDIAAIRRGIDRLAFGSIAIYLAAVVAAHSLLALATWYTIAGIAMTFTFLAVTESTDLRNAPPKTWVMLSIYYLVLLFTESRMPLLVLPAVAVFGYNGLSLRKKAVLGISVIALSLAGFYAGPVQQNIFHRGYGSLSELFSFDPDIVNTSGRLTAWPQFFAGIEDIWKGDGATSSAEFGYATFRGWTHTHNEYLRILFDYGIVGVILLAIPTLYLLVSLIRNAQRYRNNPQMRWLFAASINGLLAMLLLGVSGNVLMYIAYIGNLLFALIGCAYAAAQETR